MHSVEFAIGLFDHPGLLGIAAEDFDGPHGVLLRAWQASGFICSEPGMNPVPSCPHCGEGSPYRLGERIICNECRSSVDPRHLLLWPLKLDAFLTAIAAHLRLRGGVRMVEPSLWQLGTGNVEREAIECFYRRGDIFAELFRHHLAKYRRLLVLHGPAVSPEQGWPGRWFPLVGLFGPDGAMIDNDLAALLRPRGKVRFDRETGAVWIGNTLAGEAPLGSREFFLLRCLFDQLDQFVPYAELKREVLHCTGGSGGPEEATFCQKLKNRMKKDIPAIDRLIVTTNKGDGYRLRAEER